jgi:2-keto-4-pentenoate hydratase/2-oxohepta-3-ene-1,7-dioic acid hydratase in catechol pathway
MDISQGGAREIGRFICDGLVVIAERRGDQLGILSDEDNLPAVLMKGTSEITREVPLDSAGWLPPIDPRSRVFAVALNYQGHAQETNQTPPERPLFFYKAPTNFVGHDGKLDAHDKLSSEFDYEGEIAVVVGRQCAKVAPASALSVVGGICAFMDGSFRDLGRLKAGPKVMIDWLAAKALDTSSAMGPTIRFGRDVIESLSKRDLTVETTLNGELVQRGELTDLVFSVEQLISTLSAYMTLLPGDVIATGTPAGVGMSRGRFLKAGDIVQVDVSGLKALRVTVS